MVTRKSAGGNKATKQPDRYAPLKYKKLSKAEARAILVKAAPWMIRPEEIRKQAVKLLRKECSPAFAKQFGQFMSFAFELADLFEQHSASYPSPTLLKAQQSGAVKKEIWETLEQLNEAWKILIHMP